VLICIFKKHVHISAVELPRNFKIC